MRKRACKVNDVYPWREDAGGNRLCAVCGKPIKNKRLKYCSAACSDLAYIRTSPSFARGRVRNRDKGMCALCGCDTEKLQRILNKLRKLEYTECCAIRRELGFTSFGHLWEMDHIHPVVEGGGLCGLDGLRTLCIPCHRQETRALLSRRCKVAEKESTKESVCKESDCSES